MKKALTLALAAALVAAPLYKFRRLISGTNNRPIQPLYGRPVLQ